MDSLICFLFAGALHGRAEPWLPGSRSWGTRYGRGETRVDESGSLIVKKMMTSANNGALRLVAHVCTSKFRLKWVLLTRADAVDQHCDIKPPALYFVAWAFGWIETWWITGSESNLNSRKSKRKKKNRNGSVAYELKAVLGCIFWDWKALKAEKRLSRDAY